VKHQKCCSSKGSPSETSNNTRHICSTKPDNISHTLLKKIAIPIFPQYQEPR